MKKFDIEKIRFFSIIAGMCFVLIMVVWKAYDYLPTEYTNNIDDINKSAIIETNKHNIGNKTSSGDIEEEKEEEETVTSEDIEEDEEDIETAPRVTLNEKKKFLKPLETIYEDLTTPPIKPQAKQQDKAEKKDNSMDEMLAKADEYYNDKAYDMAISEYQDIINITENDEIKALCYENIKKIQEKTGYKK